MTVATASKAINLESTVVSDYITMATSTTATGEVFCVAPLSSPYSILPRAHTYVLVAALFAPLPRGWLFRAALAAFTSRTAIFAVDTIVLLTTLKKGALSAAPLDVLVVTDELALASIVAAWLLLRSERGARSSARGLIQFYAVVVGIGEIVGFVVLKMLGTFRTTGDQCNGTEMGRLEVFGADQMFGGGIGVVGEKIGWFILRVGVPGVAFGFIALMSAIVPRPRSAKTGQDTENRHEYWPQENPFSIYPQVMTTIGYILVIALPAMAVFIAASTEYFMFGMVPDLPTVEKITSVGQWGVWAATGAVLIATAANAVREKMYDGGNDETLEIHQLGKP